MRVICAPDSFKGTLTAPEAAEAMRLGVLDAIPDAIVECCPVADGGEGTARILIEATDGETRTASVQDPLGRPIEAEFGLLGGGIAVIEMAAASGLILLSPEERDATRTSTFGTGQLLAKALDAGAKQLMLALGGSATNDGGCGAVQALGGRFLDSKGRELKDPITGADLERIHRIDLHQLDPRIPAAKILLLCDVASPLLGPRGAAPVFAPQKGASKTQVERLQAALTHLDGLWPQQVADIPGAGAAGGLGAGAMAMLDANSRPGIEVVLEVLDFSRRVAGADLCLTGEGRMDKQSLAGKACFGVSQIAEHHDVKTIAVVGQIGDDAPSAAAMRALGMTDCVAVADHTAAAGAGSSAELLREAVRTLLI